MGWLFRGERVILCIIAILALLDVIMCFPAPFYAIEVLAAYSIGRIIVLIVKRICNSKRS